MRRAIAPLLLLTLTGCGSPAPTDWAGPQTAVVGERSRCGGLVVDVRELRIRASGWTVTATIENRSATTFAVGRPHVRGGTYFGLARPGVAHPGLLARAFAPALPRTLPPAARWSGSFSGPGHVGRGVPVRVVLGRFTPVGAVVGFLCVTDRSVRLS